MSYFTEQAWYIDYMLNYDNKIVEQMQSQIEKYKKAYEDMLKTGMFFEWNPTMCGIWETDKEAWIKEYGESVELFDTTKSDNIQDLEKIQDKLEEIINALRNAIEKGNDLHLGIIVGQTLKQLEDIAYR